MDDRLKKAVAFANYRQTLNDQLHQLKVSTQNHLFIAINGGTFTINRELMTFVHMLVQMEQESAVILDDNETPILVEDLGDFLEEILNIYFQVSNEYHREYERTRKSRKVQSILDL